MARRKRPHRLTAVDAQLSPASNAESPSPARRVARPRIWLVRASLALGAPLVFFALCEVVLRLVGFGHPTAFLLPTTLNDSPAWTSNQVFGRRFFGASYERQPAVFAVPRDKPAGPVRVIVFGESAAFGDPQPEFGLPRMLHAVLSGRYPTTRFEVINAAMTGINSHVVRLIARDCRAADGDLWVIYMGNNEVIGPFGAGTVFGPQAPPTALVRSNLAIRSTRFGQLLGGIDESLRAPPASKSAWGGLLMFVDNQLRQRDPRMKAVYSSFEKNLRDILAAAQSAGAAVVLSTVAVNLQDCAPFASLHRQDLSEAELASWEASIKRARDARAAGDDAAAIERLRDTVRIDDEYADASFELASALLQAGENKEAERYFAAARDHDVLRFRCDSTLNAIIRRVDKDAPDRVRLADAELAFAEASPAGSPGRNHFYEHVHFTFEGNYLLARTLAEQLEPLLPPHVDRATAAEWPTLEECARRLAWNDWAQLNVVNGIVGRLADAPFTNQSNHDAQMQALAAQTDELRPRADQALRDVVSLFEVALAAAPDDPALYAQRATMRGFARDSAGAVADARRATELLPMNSEHWMTLGAALATDGRLEDAAAAFAEAFERDDQNVTALQKLARVYAQLERPDEAIDACRRAIELKPHFGPAHLELGKLLEEAGDPFEAEKHFRAAVEHRVWRRANLLELAEFCASRGWHDDAADSFAAAASLDPGDVALRIKAGQASVAAKRFDDAHRHFADAVRLAPEMGAAHFLLGVELGRSKQTTQAVSEFSTAVRLMPDVVEARINLALALRNDGRLAEARQQFQLVLRHDPQNSVALRHLQSLTGATP